MIFTDTFYLNGEAVRLWIETNPETLSLDSNNVQKLPLSVRFWSGEGSDKTALAAYLTLKIESVSGSTVTTLYTYTSASAVSTYNYTIPANSYGTANRISIYAYEDAARSKEIGSKQINIVVDNPTPFPRSENWATSLIFKNGEYLLLDDVIYMWMSRVPGNTSLSPKADLSSATPSGKWKSYQNWPLFATNIALIKFGLVGSAVFKDEYMYSQQGVDASGVATSDYRKFGTSAFTPNLLINFQTGKIICNNAEIKGKITATSGSFTGEIIAQSGKIGGFTLESGSLFWKGRDYFGNDSRSVRIGVPSDAASGMIDVSFNGATTGKFGIKVIGSNSGGACIYASRYSVEASRSYPGAGSTYAGYFDGGVFVSETLTSGLCLADKFGVVVSRNADGSVTYNEGIDDNFGTMIFRKGLLVSSS